MKAATMVRAPLALAVQVAVALALLEPAVAQGLLDFGSGDEPLEITADDGIEWRRKEQVYIASGHAWAARGDLELFSDVLTASYRRTEDGGTEIYRIEAHGNVRIVSANEIVLGDDGYYDVDRGVVMLTGQNLRLETGRDTITAKESLEYWEAEQMAVARGDAVAIREDKRLRAELLVAHFEPDAEGKRALRKIDAKGDVGISTPTEFVRSDSGVYHLDKELAELAGGVKITRGEIQLNGEYAEVNLATGVSRLLGAPPGGVSDTRVRGLFVPDQEESSGDDP